ncbi:PAS domain S-box-containing protein/diguanylate cyclase (GGDEF)-like protein [Halospina denitrificans]|uniref:PAS domain S-box-containing protein/diguanylate cyclase (GGDEF)-like protein n=1 Tax=Halospina denitrificans TaxID=332522 RepID=A0A4R7JTV8_9GAMM|nr:GGDEF domain-containing protein [Halospina denitrificans]TDT41772.1 PAS domain S-box-containing protein/diguanylate cyclase (GGDEF)-like protein [Halospina denitrificans]
MEVRLSNFIRAEIEPILEDWEDFAETLLHARHMDQIGLRDHAKHMLLVIADDLDIHQSEAEQTTKSKGLGSGAEGASWAELHGGDRQTSGFSVMETASEFRALRASVVKHWANTNPTAAGQQIEELTRFHEAIDQAVAESLEQYTILKELETRLFGAVLVASPDPIYVLDLEGRFIYANQATASLFALKTEAIIGKSTYDFGFSFASNFQRHLQKVIAKQSTYRGQLTHTFASGQGERFEYLLAPVLDEHQHTEAIVCIFRDVTERALAEEKIWHNAHHDLLTGLPNRRLFLDRLNQEVKHAKRSSLALAVLFMDLDGFKEVNDSLGHEVGDALLAEVAERLSDCVREDDTIARLGGDEFTMILAGTKDRTDVERVVRTIIDSLAVPFQIAEKPVRISVSIGVSFYPRDASTPVAMLQAADQAMYKAKESGSNHLCFFDRSDKPGRHSA